MWHEGLTANPYCSLCLWPIDSHLKEGDTRLHFQFCSNLTDIKMISYFYLWQQYRATHAALDMDTGLLWFSTTPAGTSIHTRSISGSSRRSSPWAGSCPGGSKTLRIWLRNGWECRGPGSPHYKGGKRAQLQSTLLKTRCPVSEWRSELPRCSPSFLPIHMNLQNFNKASE